jgi:biopolymer transport protein ExbD
VIAVNALCLFLFLHSFIKIDVNVLNPDEDVKPEQKEIVSLAVTGSDTLYAEVRDQHVEKFGSFLQNQAIALRESHANFTNKDKKKDLSEIHQFVKQIPVRPV